MSYHIVLFEPEIPQNTGNIARTCAATDITLHLIEPLGFEIDEKRVRRAGLDYWQYVDLRVHKSLDAFLEEYKNHRKFFVTTKAEQSYNEPTYQDGDMFVFGKESAGLPRWLIDENMDYAIRIPMSKNTMTRSLNLSNSAILVAYEALRQGGFENMY